MKTILLFLALIPAIGFSQYSIDSLIKVASDPVQHDTVRINTLGILSFKCYANLNPDSSKYYGQLEHDYAKSIGYSKGVASGLTHLGEAYRKQGELDLAMEVNFDALTIFEKIENKKGQVAALNNIGNLYIATQDMPKALEYYEKAREIELSYLGENEVGKTGSNVAMMHARMGELDLALEELAVELERAERSQNYYILASVQMNIAGCYYMKQDFPAAMQILEDCIDNFIKAQAFDGAIGVIQNMASIYKVQGNLNKAAELHQRALDLAVEHNILNMVEVVSKEAHDTYNALGRYQEAYQTLQIYVDATDSINSINNQKALIEQEVAYKYDKKQFQDSLKIQKDKEVSEQKHQVELAKEEQKQYILFGGMGVLLVFGLLALRGYQRKKKDNEIISKQKEKVEHQKSIIEEAHQEITDSINYAQRIQSAILPSDSLIQKLIPNSFVLYKPKDIVAGDFYWLEETDHGLLLAAADCTGHGVPGAMVSVVCNNAMNRAVREFGLTEPGKILDKVREIVIEEFSKSGNEVKDGMDICFIKLNGNQLEFAGAHNPLWITRNGELIEHKANKQPIGQFENPEPFTTHKIDLQTGDNVYLFSDGYADQFGGDKGKKFKAKNLKQLLLSLSNENMKDQKVQIDKVFEDWKGSLEQLDDVCVIGVRV